MDEKEIKAVKKLMKIFGNEFLEKRMDELYFQEDDWKNIDLWWSNEDKDEFICDFDRPPDYLMYFKCRIAGHYAKYHGTLAEYKEDLRKAKEGKSPWIILGCSLGATFDYRGKEHCSTFPDTVTYGSVDIVNKRKVKFLDDTHNRREDYEEIEADIKQFFIKIITMPVEVIEKAITDIEHEIANRPPEEVRVNAAGLQVAAYHYPWFDIDDHVSFDRKCWDTSYEESIQELVEIQANEALEERHGE